MYLRRSIDDIVETVRNAQGRSRSCSLLIGAGCSVKGGVPLGRVEMAAIARVAAPRRFSRLTPGSDTDLGASYRFELKIPLYANPTTPPLAWPREIHRSSDHSVGE